MTAQGDVLLADLGASLGGIHHVSSDGVSSIVTELSGEALPPTNYVTAEDDGSLWFTVSKRARPRNLAWNHQVSVGFIGVKDDLGCRIVADGLGYTNEIAFSPDGLWVYVNETYAQRISRFRRLPGRALGERETVAQLGGLISLTDWFSTSTGGMGQLYCEQPPAPDTSRW